MILLTACVDIWEALQTKKIIGRKRILICFFGLVIYLIISVLFSYLTYQKREQDILKQFGEKAMLAAIDFADRTELSQKEYNRLLGLEFTSLLKDDRNINFERDARKIMQYVDIKYIYMISKLEDSKVKYRVEPGEEKIYNMPVGTPLNLVYLLDAVKSDKIREEDTGGKWYVDKDRYNVINDNYRDILNNPSPSYLIVTDRWGSYVTGYAPVWDNQENLLGYMCVDLYSKEYLASSRREYYLNMFFIIASLSIISGSIHVLYRYTAVKKIAKEKTFLSDYDDLTSVFSRRRIFEILNKEWKNCRNKKKKLCILFIDIDNFKNYNDQYGHLEGDILLTRIASVIQERINEFGGYLGRYGGDEFIIVIDSLELRDVEKMAGNIIKDIGETFKRSGDYSVTLSIGIKEVDFTSDSVDSTILQADKALYMAKENGKNRFYTL